MNKLKKIEIYVNHIIDEKRKQNPMNQIVFYWETSRSDEMRVFDLSPEEKALFSWMTNAEIEEKVKEDNPEAEWVQVFKGDKELVKSKEKFVIFIGNDGHYNRIAKPLKNIDSITFDEAKTKIGAELGEIAYFYQDQNDTLPLEIICDEEGMLNGKPRVLHNGYQYVHGNVLIGKYNDQTEKWEGLNSSEVKELCGYLEKNIHNDIQLSPLKHLIKDQEKVIDETQEAEKGLER